jgi:hypothetical protein
MRKEERSSSATLLFTKTLLNVWALMVVSVAK